jgi:hypothetical protein
MTLRDPNLRPRFSRRAILKSLGWASMAFRPAPFFGLSPTASSTELARSDQSSLPFADVRLTPHYPTESPLADVLRLVTPGSDEYVTEKYAFEIESILNQWGRALLTSVHEHRELAVFVDTSIQATSFTV